MTEKVEKSGILSWNIENINEVPSCIGVFVLRTSPLEGYELVVEKTDNLKNTLLSVYNEQMYPDVNFFDWYKTNNSKEADALSDELHNKFFSEEIDIGNL